MSTWICLKIEDDYKSLCKMLSLGCISYYRYVIMTCCRDVTGLDGPSYIQTLESCGDELIDSYYKCEI